MLALSIFNLLSLFSLFEWAKEEEKCLGKGGGGGGGGESFRDHLPSSAAAGTNTSRKFIIRPDGRQMEISLICRTEKGKKEIRE